uniref:BED-type domain-containing protein n=1 Tax=Wuchereria bancrofti TaxID=6293 RepID=A0A1I8EV22_WUCBA
MIKDEFMKASGLEYEDCDMDVENDDGSSVGGINETKGENESINDAGEEENDGGMASTSGNNLFRTQVFATQRHKPNREAKILETSIANLKKKLQTQSQTSFSASTTHSRLKRASADTGLASIREIEDLSQVTCRTALRTANEGRPSEVENCSKDSFDEGGQTAVERSLAAMTKSKYSTSSRNPFNSGVDNDDDEDNEGSKNDAFLDRIFGEGTDNNGSKNSNLYDISESVETSNPGAYISSDMTLSAALRRKRQRRNPVWPYFIVKDGVATCKHCNYSTKSVFSTNLKVHLRTHHHDLFEEVLKAEEEQQEQITTRTLPTTSRSILDSPKAFSEPQLPLDYLKTTPDLTKSLPDFLKVISEASVKSVANAPLNQTKALVTGDNERLKTLNKIPQISPSSYNITYASGRTDKVTSPMGSQSAIVLKRRRLRRHPVWRFFKDVGDGSKTVKCVNCPFSTSSPFSTNLKMHLKAHHKSDYRLILILESRQRLEEGISPIPESVQAPSSPLKKSSSEDTNISSAEEEQAEEKKRSLSTGAFEDESFTSMTNTERVKAMIEMAAANQTQSLDLQYSNVDYAAIGNTNRIVSFGSDEASIDTNLLMRLGLAKSDLVASKPPLQNKFLNAQSVVSGGTVRNHLVNAHISSALDTTKSLLELPEFKQFVDILDPTYQIPQSGYLKRLLECKTGNHDLSSEHHLDIVQEQGE